MPIRWCSQANAICIIRTIYLPNAILGHAHRHVFTSFSDFFPLIEKEIQKVTSYASRNNINISMNNKAVLSFCFIRFCLKVQQWVIQKINRQKTLELSIYQRATKFSAHTKFSENQLIQPFIITIWCISIKRDLHKITDFIVD